MTKQNGTVVWLVCVTLGLLFVGFGTMLDAGGDFGAAVVMFLLASACIMTPLARSWRRRRQTRSKAIDTLTRRSSCP